jgi:DNA-binding NarL/FixJ family response regulator
MKFIIVEDEEPVCRLIQHYLMNCFPGEHSFVVAHDVQSGLEAADSLGDLMVLDLRLPGNGDPRSTLVNFEPYIRNIDTIVMTGFSDSALGLLAIECGAKAFLCKPVLEDDFRDAIESFIKKGR